MSTHEIRIIEEMYQREPLLHYSVYTQVQVAALKTLGSGIRQVLDDAFAVDGVVDAAVFREAYPSFWLWTLGAYEIIRTMVEEGGRGCFSDELFARLEEFKRRIERLRIPFAKQELKGEKTPVRGELSVAGFSHEMRNLMFTVQGADYWMRELITQFDTLFDSIALADILADHRSGYSRRGV